MPKCFGSSVLLFAPARSARKEGAEILVLCKLKKKNTVSLLDCKALRPEIEDLQALHHIWDQGIMVLITH